MGGVILEEKSSHSTKERPEGRTHRIREWGPGEPSPSILAGPSRPARGIISLVTAMAEGGQQEGVNTPTKIEQLKMPEESFNRRTQRRKGDIPLRKENVNQGKKGGTKGAATLSDRTI